MFLSRWAYNKNKNNNKNKNKRYVAFVDDFGILMYLMGMGMGMRMGTEMTILIVHPVVFFVKYQKIENLKRLQKWFYKKRWAPWNEPGAFCL